MCGVTSQGHRASIALGTLTVGPFSGELHVNLYRGSRLVHVEAVVSTSEDRRAFLYDAGLVADSPRWQRLAWVDTEGQLRRAEVASGGGDQPRAVRHRTIVAEIAAGSVACFPPPHQYLLPARPDRQPEERLVRVGPPQSRRPVTGSASARRRPGAARSSPGSTRPPGPSSGWGSSTCSAAGTPRTRSARRSDIRTATASPSCPGTSRSRATGTWRSPWRRWPSWPRGRSRTTPDFVTMFKDMNVNLVHLAEFHGDGHQFDAGPAPAPRGRRDVRRMPPPLRQLALAPARRGDQRRPWPSAAARPAPRPLDVPLPAAGHLDHQPRARTQPFVEQDPHYGTVYHVGEP